MDFGIHNDRQIRMSNYINGRNLIFFPTKKKLKSMHYKDFSFFYMGIIIFSFIVKP